MRPLPYLITNVIPPAAVARDDQQGFWRAERTTRVPTAPDQPNVGKDVAHPGIMSAGTA